MNYLSSPPTVRVVNTADGPRRRPSVGVLLPVENGGGGGGGVVRRNIRRR